MKKNKIIGPQTLKRSFTLIRSYFSHFFQRGTQIIMNGQGSVSYSIIKIYTRHATSITLVGTITFLDLETKVRFYFTSHFSYLSIKISCWRLQGKIIIYLGEGGVHIFLWATEIKFRIWENVFVGHRCPRFQLK